MLKFTEVASKYNAKCFKKNKRKEGLQRKSQ